MYFRCSAAIHACPPSADVWSIRFLDLNADPVDPPLLATYTPSRKPHEMFLWTDPANPSRALLWLSTPTTSVDPGPGGRPSPHHLAILMQTSEAPGRPLAAVGQPTPVVRRTP